MDPDRLYEAWRDLRASTKGLHALEMAQRLGVSECELLASACGREGSPSSVRLAADWPAFVARLPSLGTVKAVTRNPNAVIEVIGTYDRIEFFGPMGQSVSSIDLRMFIHRWRHAFAFRDETSRGTSRGIAFFDAQGDAVHKLFLREQSDAGAFDALVAAHTSQDQSPRQDVAPPSPPQAPKPDAQIDVPGLRTAWRAMTDTHEFHGLLRRFAVQRTQALRLAGEDLARPAPTSSVSAVLEEAQRSTVPIMVFVGNPGNIQIYSGPVRRVVRMGAWINVLDPGFDLHVREGHITEAWVVRKPTADGVVTSLEAYDAAGELVALLVGTRKPGQTENAAWRAVVEALPAP